MLCPIVSELVQARRQRDARILQCLADAQPGVPALVPANALVRGDRGLDAGEELVGSRARLAPLEINEVHGSVILVNRTRGGAVSVTVSTSGQLSVVLEPTRAASVHRRPGAGAGRIGEFRRWRSSCRGSPQLAAAVARASWVMCA